MRNIAPLDFVESREAVVHVTGPKGHAGTWQLRDGENITIGSGCNCQISLNDPSVSRMHCIVRFEAGEIHVHDWCSESGTIVNGQAAHGEVIINSTDRVSVGKYSLAFDSNEVPPNSSTSTATKPEPVDVSSGASNAGGRSPSTENAISAPSNALQPSSVTKARLACSNSVTPGTQVTSVLQDTVDLLKSELELLQEELDVKNSMLADFQCGIQPIDSQIVAPELERRIERLVDELQQSDLRVSSLEDLLRLTEESRQADSEERTQVEQWIHDLEQRMAEREGEMIAECDVIHQRCKQAIEERDEALRSVQSFVDKNATSPAIKEMLESRAREIESLKSRIDEYETQCRQLTLRCRELEEESGEEFHQRQVSEAIRLERLQLAQARAAISRKELEIAAKVNDLQHQLDLKTTSHPADERFRAFKEQLAILHEKDKREHVPDTLGMRLARLWQKLDGPTDRD